MLAAISIEALDSAPDAPLDCPPNFSRPSPEEGHRLIQDFLRIKRADLRDDVFKFLSEILRVQDEG